MYTCGEVTIQKRTWRVFFTCWLVYTFYWTPYIIREHFPALALADRGSLNVDRYLGWTEDISALLQAALISTTILARLLRRDSFSRARPLLTRVDRWNQSLPRPNVPANASDVFRRTVNSGRGFISCWWRS